MRQIHAATGRVVIASELRRALSELQTAGVIAVSMLPSGPRGGRRREVWRVLTPESAVIAEAMAAIASRACGFSGRHHSRPWRPSQNDDVRCADFGLAARHCRRRRLKPVPADIAQQIFEWVASGDYLRDYCRRPGAPAARTVYAWTAKDPVFRSRFRQARDYGEEAIRDHYMDLLQDKHLLDLVASDRKARREFRLRYVRPIDLRLQRWRRHPRRGGVRRG